MSITRAECDRLHMKSIKVAMAASLFGVAAFVWIMHLPPQAIASDPWSWVAIAIGCVLYLWSFHIESSWRRRLDAMIEEMQNRIIDGVDSVDAGPTSTRTEAGR